MGFSPPFWVTAVQGLVPLGHWSRWTSTTSFFIMYMGKSLACQFSDDVNQKMVTKHRVQNLRGDDDPKWLIQNDWYIAIYFSIRLKRTKIALMLESQTIQPSLTLQYWLMERFPATWCNMFQSMRIACWDGFKEVTLECRQENIPKHYFEQIRKTIKNNHLHIYFVSDLERLIPSSVPGRHCSWIQCLCCALHCGKVWSWRWVEGHAGATVDCHSSLWKRTRCRRQP